MYQPRIRQVYFCKYPKDTELPEFGKKRPVVVFSKTNKLGVAVVVPITSKPQSEDGLSVQISSPFDGRPVWVICNHPTTVAVSRLERQHPKKPVPRISEADFQDIVAAVLKNLPTPR